MANSILSCLVIIVLGLVATACSGINSDQAPAPLSSYKVEWVNNQIPTEMEAGKDYKVTVTLKNTSEVTWPWTLNGRGRVHISYHWLPTDGDKPIVWDGVRSGLPHDIAPGETFTTNEVQVVAPQTPGFYRLQLTLVHENVGWFEQKGASTLIVPVKIN